MCVDVYVFMTAVAALLVSVKFSKINMFVRLRPTLKHSFVILVYQPSLTYLKPWHHVMSGAICNVAGVDVDASTVST